MARFLRTAFTLICYLIVLNGRAQSDDVGSGHALVMDGVDDYVDLGNIYDNLQFPITISAWVYVDGNTSNWAPVFVSQDNAPVYNGFWFLIQPTIMAIGYGDGFGENDPAFRRGKSASFSSIANRWVHIAGVIRSATDMDLFLNGINIGGSYAGFTNSPMSSTSTDVAKIGYWYSNGQVTRFKGKLDEVRIWNRSLTQDQIRDTMCKKIEADDLGLIGYWNFNELSEDVLIDKSDNHFNGTLKNSPMRIFSGAPLGDVSYYKYPPSTTDVISLKEGDDLIMIKNIKGFPEGIQIYKIGDIPSQVNGLNTSAINSPYFGVYMTSLDTDNSFEVDYSFQNNAPCSLFDRSDNSSNNWISREVPLKNVVQLGEFIKGLGQKVSVDLGQDVALCDIPSLKLSFDKADDNYSYEWSTGEVSPEITVTKSGAYSLRVSGSCNTASDTVKVQLLTRPQEFSLGEDKEECPLTIQRLQPYDKAYNDIQFTWQDGSQKPYFDVKEYGTYSVIARNGCGETMDSIMLNKPSKIAEQEFQNVITPNADTYNQYFYIDQAQREALSLVVVNRWGKRVFYSYEYKNNWDGDELPAGVYFYTLRGECLNEMKGSISIIR